MLPSEKEAWGKSVSLEMEGSGRFDGQKSRTDKRRGDLAVEQSDVSAGLAFTVRPKNSVE